VTVVLIVGSQFVMYGDPGSPLLLHPFTRVLLKGDPLLSYPLEASTVSTTMLFVFAFLGGPASILAAVAAYSAWGYRSKGAGAAANVGVDDRSVLIPVEREDESGVVTWRRVSIRYRPLVDALVGLVSFLSALALTALLTDAGKVYCGRPRPDFFARQAEAAGAGEGVDESGLVRDGLMSFPSGHASLSFATATYVSLFLAARTAALSPTRVTSPLTATLLSLPLLLAYFIAMSRTRDYHHNFVDILAGSLLGLSSSLSVFSFWYRFPWQPFPAFPKALWEPDIDDDAHISKRLRIQ
jgi:membrane-associated phospholipid phosphatase